ncbi:hypothetical protein Hanom_Chr09g00862981 [Helianthus anomalus]
MSSSSNSSCSVKRNYKIFKVDLEANLYCHHEIVAIIRVAGQKLLYMVMNFMVSHNGL